MQTGIKGVTFNWSSSTIILIACGKIELNGLKKNFKTQKYLKD